ncbi:hypothetical protein ACJD0Z_06305 [Flavobacteriaceae bacterium M23B6Z8]
MKLPTLFKQQRNKSYNYTPRYYDERKERLENLMKKKEVKKDEDYFEGYRKKSYREDWKAARNAQTDKNARLRFYVILAFLIMFAAAAVKYINFDKFF